MLRVPLRISSVMIAVFRSRPSTLVAARRTAKVQPRWTRGVRSRRTCRRAWNRSLPISAMVRTNARMNPWGSVRNPANVRRFSTSLRESLARLIVRNERSASPVKMLETDTPPSASSPRPSLARSSMIAASAGRLATSNRPSSRSYQRKAGTRSMVPWRIPSWLAGVVQGSWGVHSRRTWSPEDSQRRMVGTEPAATAQRRTGNGRPSSWMKTTPSTSGSSTSATFVRRRSSEEAKASSVPEVVSQATAVPVAATIHEATIAAPAVVVIPGESSRAT